VLIAFSVSLPLSVVRANASAGTYYVSKAASSVGDGTSWADAWNELDKINWSVIKPGDTIYLDGGSTSMMYATPLIIGANGTHGSPITIKLSTEKGRNGQAIIYGGRSTLLPEGGAYPNGWKLPTDQPNRKVPYGIYWDNKSYITIDGSKWKGIDIHGCNDSGIYLKGSNNMVMGITVYDCGSWGKSQERAYSGAPQNPAIFLGGPNNTIAYCILHDCGEDGIQAEQHTDCSNIIIDHTWIYNSRAHSQRDSSFNWAMHSDAFQYWAPGNFTNITIQNSIMGPGCGVILGEGKCIVSDVSFINSLFIGFNTRTGTQQIQGLSKNATGWAWDHCTIAGPHRQAYTPIEYTGFKPSIKNSIISGWSQGVELADHALVVSNNFVEFDNIVNVVNRKDIIDVPLGKVADPQYVNPSFAHVGGAGWDAFDFTPQNAEVAHSGAGSTIRSVSGLMSTFPGGNSISSKTPKTDEPASH